MKAQNDIKYWQGKHKTEKDKVDVAEEAARVLQVEFTVGLSHLDSSSSTPYTLGDRTGPKRLQSIANKYTPRRNQMKSRDFLHQYRRHSRNAKFVMERRLRTWLVRLTRPRKISITQTRSSSRCQLSTRSVHRFFDGAFVSDV